MRYLALVIVTAMFITGCSRCNMKSHPRELTKQELRENIKTLEGMYHRAVAEQDVEREKIEAGGFSDRYLELDTIKVNIRAAIMRETAMLAGKEQEE